MKYTDDSIFSGERVISKAYAKINLSLDITGIRNDGYHELATVMQTISLFDLVIIDKSDEIKLTTNYRFLPNNMKNIAYKAAYRFLKAARIDGGARILLHKNIPVGAGLAGGSTNAAAVLKGLNRLYGYPLTETKLLALGAELGADVPFCMCGGTMLCEGIGEKLTELPTLKNVNILIVKPKESVSTADVYKAYDAEKYVVHPDTEGMIEAIKNDNLADVCKNVANVLEPVTSKRCHIIKGIKETMKKNGAMVSEMSGSGSAVFGIFSSVYKADKCAKLFYPDFEDVYTVTTI